MKKRVDYRPFYPLFSEDPTLHLANMQGIGRQYWACTMPERPADESTIWSHHCRACILHLTAALLTEPRLRKLPINFTLSVDHVTVQVDLADSVAFVAEEWHDQILVEIAARFGGDAERVRQKLATTAP